MNLQLLGPVQASVDDRPIPLGTTKQRAVLAMLALQPNTTLPVDRLVDGLWGEDPPASAAKMIQLYVSQLRRLLAGSDAGIVTHGRGYELRIPEDAIDAARLERLVDRAARDDGAGSGAAREAVALWRGAALADVASEPFAPAEIRRLEELWLRATELTIDADLAAGREHEALARLERLIDEHPLRERLHAQRMLALYRCGRQAEALDSYRHARRLLVEQIGAEPGPELRRLHDAVLQQDPALELSPPTPQARAAKAPRTARRFAPLRRSLLLGAGAVFVAAIVVFAVARWTRPDGLPRIAANTVRVIDADDGDITAQYAVGRGAAALAVRDGAVWVANRLDGTVSKIEAAGDRTVTTIQVGDEPVGLAVSPGALWVSDRGAQSVLQVNIEANRVVRRIEDVGNAPGGIAAGFGSIWVVSEVDRTVTRIDPDNGSVTKRIDVGANPTAVAAGAGAVWVASEEAGTVFRIEPRSGAVTETINAGNGPAAIAVGAGAVWVANRQDATVWRIDPGTGSADSVRVGRDPTALATGAGAVWVASSGAGMVSRIDPAAARVAETVEVGNRPVALGVDGGSVWAVALESAESHRGGTLRVAFNGLCCLDTAAYFPTLQWLAYDGLVGYRSAGGSTFGTIVADLATDVPEPSPDGRTYVFTLRPGIRYSDGAPVQPDDFRASLERVLRRGGGAGLYDRIVGARGCVTRPGRCDLSRGIETDGRARTITIHLTEPDAELLHKLAVPFAYVVPADQQFRGTEAPPGTGPYTIARFDEQRGARLVRNPHFRVWSEAARPDGVADEIVVRVRRDMHANVAGVQRGDADVVRIADQFGTAHSPARLTAVAAQSAGQLYTSAAPALEFMFLNVRTPPFDDVRVRRALNYAVDRRAIVERSGGRAVAQLTCQILPPGFPGYVPSCPYTMNPSAAGSWTAPDIDKARRLIERSGTRGTRVTVWGHDDKRPILRYFAALLRRLGYDADARIFRDYFAYKSAIASPKTAQIGIEGFAADYAAPSNFAPSFVCMPPSYRPEKLSGFCDRRIAAKIDVARAARGAAADALWRRVYERIGRAAPAVPLVNRRTLTLVSRRVGNYQDHPLWGPLLDQLWVR